MTNQSDSGLTSNWLIGEVAGIAVVLLILVGLLQWNRRRRHALRERPPERTKLLRPAGYALQQQLQDLSDKLDQVLLHVIGAGAVLGVCLEVFSPAWTGLLRGQFTVAQLFAHPKRGVLVSAALLSLGVLLWGVRSLLRLLQLTEEARAHRLGLRGEQAVAEALGNQSVVSAGYTTFHDVPGDGAWNIDHVVVGPGGVFVIETKTRSRRKAKISQEEHVVTYDGRTLQFPWCEDHEAAKQAGRNAEWVRKFIVGFAPRDILVQPVIVVPGWYVETKGKYSVMVMNQTWLIGFLMRERKHFTQEQLEPLLRRFEERCRDVDF